MLKLVICKVQVAGFHKWKEAFEEVDYLRNRHRHVFEIEVAFKVETNDRQLEIIDTQNKILEYLFANYGKGSYECEFDNRSCEDIAEDLLEAFNASHVKVTEDGFGGSMIISSEVL